MTITVTMVMMFVQDIVNSTPQLVAYRHCSRQGNSSGIQVVQCLPCLRQLYHMLPTPTLRHSCRSLLEATPCSLLHPLIGVQVKLNHQRGDHAVAQCFLSCTSCHDISQLHTLCETRHHELLTSTLTLRLIWQHP